MIANSAIAYCRVSTDKQMLGGLSLSEQRNRINKYANKYGLKIAFTLSESKSGRRNNTIMEHSKSKVKHIIVTDVSRFCRDVDTGLLRIQELVKNDKTVHFIEEDIAVDKHNFTNKIGNVYKKLLSALSKAEEESIRIGMRISNIKRFKKRRGEFIGGRLPFGLDTFEYPYVDDEGNNKLVKKYKLNSYEISVIEFIEKCNSFHYTGNDLTKLMRQISKHQDPIELVHECRDKDDYNYGYDIIADVNTEPMSFTDIAKLLNIYEVTYRGTLFTPSIIRRIRSSNELKQYIIGSDDEQLEELVNNLTNFGFNNSKKSKEYKREPGENSDEESYKDSSEDVEMYEEPLKTVKVTHAKNIHRSPKSRTTKFGSPKSKTAKFGSPKSKTAKFGSPKSRTNPDYNLNLKINLKNQVPKSSPSVNNRSSRRIATASTPRENNLDDDVPMGEYEEFLEFQKFLKFKKRNV